MRTTLRKMGNSSGIILPRAILAEIGATIGEEFEVAVEGGRIVATPYEKTVRAGWAKAAAALAASDEKPAWPEFANDDDADLEW